LATSKADLTNPIRSTLFIDRSLFHIVAPFTLFSPRRRSKNVTIQTQVPFYVATKLAKLRESFTVPSPKAYVDLASRWIGHGGDVVVSPFWPHALQGWVLDCLPNFITDGIVNSMHHGIRKRGMKKAAMKKA